MLDLEPVGNYAVRIKFDDCTIPASFPGTTCTGSAWSTTRRWRDYLAALQQQGLSREPKRG